MEFYHDAVRVLETLAKALSGAFGADWRCEKRRTNAPALSVGGWYAAGGAVLLRNRKHIRPPIRAQPAGTYFQTTKLKPTTTNFFLKSGGIYYGFL